MASKFDGLLEYLLINHRWLLVCLFVLPASFIYDILFYLRNWIVFTISSAPKQHDSKVKYVQEQVKRWAKSGKKTQMCTARPGWQTTSFRRALYKNYLFKIEVNLVDILDVDPKKEIVRVEPLVTMGQLTKTLNPLGWTIPVLPELDDLTIGGLVMGTGIESSSHKFGLFQHICESFELVLSNASVVKCSRNQNPDLFYSIPWSYGTLGILTAVEIRMIPAKKYVKLTYTPFKTINKMCEAFQTAAKNKNNEFIEGLMFNKNEGVLMTGIMTDFVERNQLNEIGRWYKPWFFMYVKSLLKNGEKVIEYIPLRDYYHRHTRSLFWEVQDIIPFGNNPFFRYTLGWIAPPKVSLLKLTQTQTVKRLYESKHVIQDMLVPITALKTSIELFHEVFQPDSGMVHPQSNKSEIYVDIGVYGVPKADDFNPRKSTRVIEKFVTEVKGFQMLYADTYTTREEFRTMFDHSLYDKLRDELDCKTAFPEVYDKICKSART